MGKITSEVNHGSYELQSCVIKPCYGGFSGFDAAGIIEKIEITESIYSMFCNYEITINDGLNILEKNAIRGNEKVTLTLSKENDGASITKNLIVLEIKDFTRVGNQGQVFVLRCAIEEAVTSSIARISRSYKNELATTLILKLYLDVIHHTAIVPDDFVSEGNYDVVFPNVTYKEAIEMMLKKAQHEGGKSGPFYVFETLWNNFLTGTTYKKMVGEPAAGDTFKAEDEQKDDEQSGGRYESNKYRIKAIESKMEQSRIKEFINGGITSRSYIVDVSTKDYNRDEELKYKVLEKPPPSIQGSKQYLAPCWTSSEKTWNHPFFEESRFYLIPKNKYAFGPDDSSISNLNGKQDVSFAIKSACFHQGFAMLQSLVIEGNTEIKAGVIMNIELPKATVPGDGYDTILSGRYLVTSVVHKMARRTNGSYLMQVHLNSDSLVIGGG